MKISSRAGYTQPTIASLRQRLESSAALALEHARALVDGESRELGAPAVGRPLAVEHPHPSRLRRDVGAREATSPRFLFGQRFDELLFHDGRGRARRSV